MAKKDICPLMSYRATARPVKCDEKCAWYDNGRCIMWAIWEDMRLSGISE